MKMTTCGTDRLSLSYSSTTLLKSVGKQTMAIYLTRAQIEEQYPISKRLLEKLASLGGGPRFYMPAKIALYRLDEFEAWIESAPCGGGDIDANARRRPQQGRKNRATSASDGSKEGPRSERNGRTKSLCPSAFSRLNTKL